LVETLVSAAVASAVLAALITAAVSIQRSIAATDQFLTNTTGQSRLMDYISQDLRRAVRVGVQEGGVNTPLRSQQNVSITETTVLTIDVPDYYAANTPDNAAGSPYKTGRYPRISLNTLPAFNSYPNPLLHGTIPWADAVLDLNHRSLPRFAPPTAGDGTLQVRYYQAARGHTNALTCFYRAEFPSGATTATEVREIADCFSAQTSGVTLTISNAGDGQSFRLESKFSPRYRYASAPSEATTARLDVILRNPRRD
jgi:hypothetical protein